MLDEQLTEHLERYRRDRDPVAFGSLAAAAMPLIGSIAMQRLRDPHLVDDARQEVLIRLSRHADAIHGSVAAWVSATTRTVCVDLIRRQASQRRRIAELAGLRAAAATDEALIADSVRRRLDDALALLDPQTQALVRQRFLRGQPLRSVADEFQTSIATASRHVNRAIAELQQAYESLGIDGLTADALLDTVAGDARRTYRADAGLSSYLHRPNGPRDLAGGAPRTAGPDGWPRPIRIGVIVSHTSAIWPNHLGSMIAIENQVQWIRFLADPRFELVGVIEPGSGDQPQVERIIRSFDLAAGLIDGTDSDAMRTLDVIYLGWQPRIAPAMIRAVADAVREGIGCYNAGVTYTHRGDYHRLSREDPYMQGLRLAEAVLGAYCTTDVGWPKGRHMVPVPVTIQSRHETIPGLEPGDRLNLAGCGLLVRPKPGVQVLATQERLVRHTCGCADCHAAPMTTEELPMHEMMVGTYGRGRVFVSQSPETEPVLRHPKLEGNWLETLFTWLAEPRRPAAVGAA